MAPLRQAGMGFRCVLAAGVAVAVLPSPAPADTHDGSWVLASPSGIVSMSVQLVAGTLQYSVSRDGAPMLQTSQLGMVRADGDFSSDLSLISASTPDTIDECFPMFTGKSSEVRNHATEQTLEFTNSTGKHIQLIYRAYDDGVAFRYRFPETSVAPYTVTDEITTFSIGADGRAVLQPRDPESLHSVVATQDPPQEPGGWALPALFDLGYGWVMLAESDVDASSYAAQLNLGAGTREFHIRIPDNGYGTREPTWTLPWEMPWRAILIAPDIASVIRSDLVSALADSCRISDTSWIRPGRASWHWWSGASVASMTTLQHYIDVAQYMGWEYSVIDADWDDYHSDEAMRGLVNYAAARGVGIFLWYNSAGPQNNYSLSPRDRLWDPATRQAEMAKIASWGVKGIKVDFFDSEKQIAIQHYVGILEDAAGAGLLVCFHGSTPPRGWSRTWPNMMSTEAVRGTEYYKMDPDYPAAAPLNNVALAFTRNVVGSMDYTPVTFSNSFYPHLTTNAHELALSVIFESGLLTLADSYGSYQSQPQEVQDFLRRVPAAWDEVRFLEGDPASHVVLARRKGGVWYVAGINGASAPRNVSIDLAPFGYDGTGAILIGDGSTPHDFSTAAITGTQLEVTMAGRGGFATRLPAGRTDVPTDPDIDPNVPDHGPPSAGGRALRFERVWPNPFAGATRITYTLARGDRVSLAVYDCRGRRLHVLVDEFQPAGRHSIRWDGADQAGVPAASGVYFCRLASGGEAATVRIQLVR